MGISRPDTDAIRSVLNKPREEWPDCFEVRWDYSPQNFFLAGDGDEPEDYTEADYLIGEADLAEIDSKLHGHSFRANADLWAVATSKVAGAILHWSAGGLMTPPHLEIAMGHLVIAGGNNRMAVCRADGQLRLPFLYPVGQADLFAAKLTTFSPRAAA